MRPQTALVCLLVLLGAALAMVTHTPGVLGQTVSQTGEPAAVPPSSLDFGTSFDRSAKHQFEQQLTVGEQQRLVMLRSRFALADEACPLPETANQPFYLKLNTDLTRTIADRLETAGASFIGYANPHTHILRARDAQSLERIREIIEAEPAVRGTLLQRPEDTVTSGVFERIPKGNLAGEYEVLFWRDAGTDRCNLLLTATGALVLEGSLTGASPLVTAWLPDAGVRELIGNPWVEQLNLRGVKVITNQTSAAMSNADPATIGAAPYNLDGTDQIVAVWDAGVARDTHEQFQNAPTGSLINNGTKRILKVNGSASLHDHATHVTGTIIGDGTGNAQAQGYAYKSYLLSHLWNNIDAERRAARHNWNHVADNHSYADFNGGSNDWGEYNSGTQAVDITNRDLLLCQVQSAGNYQTGLGSAAGSAGNKPFGNSNPTDSVPTYNAHRNGFIIAAAKDNEDLTGFSSCGPAEDGRLVPQFCANGEGLTSTISTGDSNYDSYSGTSMSGPSVCGSVVLLSQLWRREHNDQMFTPDVARAVLAQTCRDKYNVGPDYHFGFGIVDCQAAADLVMADKAGGGDRIFRGTARSGDVKEYSFNVSTSDPVHIVLSWLDIWASTSASTTLVNDLDIEVEDPNGTTYYPYSGVSSVSANDHSYTFTTTGPNRRDNIELVHVDSPMQGNWILRVTANSVPANPQSGVPNDSTGFVVASSHSVNLQKLLVEDAVNGAAPVSIPDNNTGGINRTFSVNDSRIVVGVRVHARINHERRGDLAIKLTSALGTSVDLKTTNNGSLDDETDVIAVFPDTKQDDDDVSAILYEYAQGTWSVRITDTVSGNSGSLEYLTLELDLRTNAAPNADAGTDFDVRENNNGQLDGTGSDDADGDSFSYAWSQTGGAITLNLSGAGTAQPTFTAPGVSQDEACTFKLTVTDTSGDSTTDSVTVTVKNNLAPVADAGADITLIEGDNGQLDASGSTDPENDAMSYAWVQTAGTITLTPGNPTAQQPGFTTPTPITQNELVTFEVTVTDSRGDSSTDSVDVMIEMNLAPQADAGPSFAVVWSASAQLDGSASSDPNTGDVLSYSWVQIAGTNTVTLSSASAMQPTFTAPAVDDTLIFQLTVTDLRGETSVADVWVWVNETGSVPVSGGSKKSGGGCSTGTGNSWWYGLVLLTIGATLWMRRVRHARVGD